MWMGHVIEVGKLLLPHIINRRKEREREKSLSGLHVQI